MTTIDFSTPHRDAFAELFINKRLITQEIRDLATPVARMVLGDEYVDNKNGWLGWDVTPIFDGGTLIALNFTAITHDDRGPDTRKTTRVAF